MAADTQTEGRKWERADSLFHQYVSYGGLEKPTADIDAETLRVEHSDEELRALLQHTDEALSEQGKREKGAEQALSSWTRGFARRALNMVNLGGLLQDDQLSLEHARAYQKRLSDFRSKLVVAVASGPALNREERTAHYGRKSEERYQAERREEADGRILGLAEETKVPLDIARALVPCLDAFQREQHGRAILMMTGNLSDDELNEYTVGPRESALIEEIRNLGAEGRSTEQVERWAMKLAERMSRYYGLENMAKEVHLAICHANGVPTFDDESEL